MKYLQRTSLVYFCLIFLALYQRTTTNPEARLKFAEYCAYHAYPTETHIFQTQDGYNLKFFRLQAKNQTIEPKEKVVYLQHGLQDSSDTWVVNNQSLAPGFILANKGYDVWIGNSRGNAYSSPQLNPKVRNFWDFSFDEMIQYDLPSAFAYIHNVTSKKIHYIGHSQGTLIMFAALANKNPVIKSLISSFSALGPVAYLTHQQSKLIQTLIDLGLMQTLKSLDVKQMFYTQENIKYITSIIAGLDPKACDIGLLEISQMNNTVNNLDRMPTIMGHFPSGSSLKNMQHFQQYVKKAVFSKFDYGQKMNMKKYGTPEPPVYNLENIDFPVHMFVGKYDRLADVNDSNKLYEQLKNSPDKSIRYLEFGHATFIWGKSTQHIESIINIIESS